MNARTLRFLSVFAFAILLPAAGLYGTIDSLHEMPAEFLTGVRTLAIGAVNV